MAGQASLPTPLCVTSGPSVHPTTRKGEGERRGVGGRGGIHFCRLCVCVCACSSAYFFRPDAFTVQRFFALCLVVVMGRSVPLPGKAFFWGRTSTPEEEEEDEEEEELLPSSEVAELSLPLDELCSAEDPDSTELASSSGFHSQSERPREASEKDALSLSTTFATFKVLLVLSPWAFFWLAPFFSHRLGRLQPIPSNQRCLVARCVAPCQVSSDVQNPRAGSAPGDRTFTGHVFSFVHGHCELQWDHTRACAAHFLAHNTCGTRACCVSTKTTHPWVHYNLSFLQVHCHMIAHPCQSNGRSTKETKLGCFRGPHASMCHTSVWLCTQLRTVGHLCGFHKGRQGAH